MLERSGPVQPVDGVFNFSDRVARAQNPFVDQGEVDGPVRLDGDSGLAAAGKGCQRICQLLDLFVEGVHMNRYQPVIFQLSPCFVLTEYVSVQKLLFDPFGELVRGQAYGLDLPNGLKSDHPIGADSHSLIELGIKDELDAYLIERIELVGPHGDVPFGLKEQPDLVIGPEAIVPAHDIKGFGKVRGLRGFLRSGGGSERGRNQADTPSEH